MFVDDDVVLRHDCIAALIEGLRTRPAYGALAADYRGDAARVLPARYVTMGATLFRRSALSGMRFRCERNKCECECCCHDLRKNGLGVDYWPAARAWHLANNDQAAAKQALSRRMAPQAQPGAAPAGRVLTAFDRRHFDLFQRQFLASLRDHGNEEWVTVVGYGLWPSQKRQLERLRRVELYQGPFDITTVPRRRIRDFQSVVGRLDRNTPVAYWDAGDAIFQGSLAPLWELVRAHPDRMLAVREPVVSRDSRTVYRWTASIWRPAARWRAYRLLATHPFLNGGFAAGSAATMLRFFRGSFAIRNSSAMRGSINKGDQTAMNLYCHTHPTHWMEVEAGWNYTLNHRLDSDFYLQEDGRLASRKEGPIYVIHGNASTLPRVAGQRHRIPPGRLGRPS